MRKFVLAVVSTLVLFIVGAAVAKEAADPFQWLEDVEGEKALTWVRGQNDRSLTVLQADPRFEDLQANTVFS